MPWRLPAMCGQIVPPPFRDAFYDMVARNRLRWFGAREQCLLPDPSQADRFLS
jgi:predicted DCC family thiol-disulfide oxidoreductase YuxK